MHQSQELFDTFCKEQLNPEQRIIVNEPSGVLIVHAGAGSGKTRVITARVTNLMMHHGVTPRGLIALTFTNKAAREMKERVMHFLGAHALLPFVGTFHSYCVSLLRKHRDVLEYPEFSIMDDDDQEKLIKSIINRHNINKKITPRTVSSYISRLKNNAADGIVDFNQVQDFFIRDLMVYYEQEKKASKCFDFDDLLLEALRLFKHHPEIKQQHQSFVRHILVDEFQDTNHVQHALLREMTLDANRQFSIDSFCVVGDEDQSIYSWRGAVPGTMMMFYHDYPMARASTLEQNYRSVQPVLDVANDLIQYNTARKKKHLWSEKTASDRIRLINCVSGYQEAELIAETARALIKRGSSLKSCAVLYRSHYQSRLIEEALIRHSLPYVILGGVQFYDRQEVKDLLAYLKLLVNPFDRVSWSRAINTPSRGLGDKFQELFFETWDKQPFMNFIDLSRFMIEQGLVNGTKKTMLQAFVGIFERLDLKELPSVILENVITATHFNNHLSEAYEIDEVRERQGNVKELMNAFKAREEEGIVTLSAVLEEIALVQDARKQPAEERDCVKLMTLHSAKGLEFDMVMLVGLEEGTLPSSHSMANNETVEEERRLLYVGITRARDHLIMIYANYRYMYGQMTDAIPSRFINEFAQSRHVQALSVAQWNMTECRSYLQDWLAQKKLAFKNLISSKDDVVQLVQQKQQASSKSLVFEKPAWLGTPSTSKAKNATHQTMHKTAAKPKAAQAVSAVVVHSVQKSASEIQVAAAKKTSGWRVNQEVHHDKFGTGVIEAIDEKNIGTIHLTIRFAAGTKKIRSDFIRLPE